MKLVTKQSAQTHSSGERFIAKEYNTLDPDINIAYVEVNGRHPETGKIANTLCKELIYVAGGGGKLIINDQTIDLSEGDVILIEPNEKCHWEGQLQLVPACHPAWTFDQVASFDA